MAALRGRPGPGAGDDEPGTVRPTPLWAYAVALVLGILLALIGKQAAELTIGNAPVPYFTVVPLVLLAGVTFGSAVVARRRIQLRRELVAPRLAVGWLALAKTAGLAGAGLTGGFAAYALASTSRLATSQGGARVLHSSLAAAGGILLLIAGVLLERACRVPRDESTPKTSG